MLTPHHYAVAVQLSQWGVMGCAVQRHHTDVRFPATSATSQAGGVSQRGATYKLWLRKDQSSKLLPSQRTNRNEPG